jgi:nitrite reductase (NADH) small subunit
VRAEGSKVASCRRAGAPESADTATMSNRQDEPAGPAAAVPGFRPGFLEVGTLDQLPPGAALHVAVGAAGLALVNTDGHVVAIGDLCLRCGGSLSTAALAGVRLTCSRCGWQYDVEHGCVVGLPELAIERHEVRVDDGRLLVAIAALEPPPSAP